MGEIGTGFLQGAASLFTTTWVVLDHLGGLGPPRWSGGALCAVPAESGTEPGRQMAVLHFNSSSWPLLEDEKLLL